MRVLFEFDHKRYSCLLDGGRVRVNAPPLNTDAGPCGGPRVNGMGRQLGPEGLETLRKTRLVWIDPNCGTRDCWWFPYADRESCPGAD